MQRTIILSAAITLLLLLTALPAVAGVTDSGYKYCSTRKVTYHHASWGSGGGFWFVESDGSLNDPGTYAYCSSLS